MGRYAVVGCKLQVVIIMLMSAARFVQVLQDFFIVGLVVIGALVRRIGSAVY